MAVVQDALGRVVASEEIELVRTDSATAGAEDEPAGRMVDATVDASG